MSGPSDEDTPPDPSGDASPAAPTERESLADPGRTETGDFQPVAIPPAEASLGRVWGKFVLLERLGHGGQGTVWEALQSEGIVRRVALKIMNAPSDDCRLNRLRKEAQRLGEFAGEGIVSVHEYGEHLGMPFLSMALIRGGSLGKMIADRKAHLAGRTPVRVARVALMDEHDYLREVARAIRDVARALDCCHQENLVHRDLKPSNLLLDDRDSLRALLGDFGLARDLDDITEGAEFDQAGTRQYMPPEKLLGERGVDEKLADVYGLGACLYELVTLSRPRERPNDLSNVALLQAMAASDPTPTRQVNRQVPRDLAAVIDMALDRNPKRRYASAGAFAADVGRWLEDEPVQARPAGRGRRAWRRLRKRRLLMPIGVMLGLLIGFGSYLAWRHVQERLDMQTLTGQVRAGLDAGMPGTVLTKASDLARRGGPDSEGARLATEVFESFVRRGPAQSVQDFSENVALLRDNFPAEALPPATSARLIAELEALLGRADLEIVTVPPGVSVRIYPMDPLGAPNLRKPPTRIDGGDADAPTVLDDLPASEYWVIAQGPELDRWVERRYVHNPSIVDGRPQAVRLTLWPRTLAEASGPEKELAPVPAATFPMGEDYDATAPPPLQRASPRHEATIAAFHLGRGEATRGQFLEFLRQARPDWADAFRSGRTMSEWREDGPDWRRWPLDSVTFEQMNDYAAWRGCRHPTEAELEGTARLGHADRIKLVLEPWLTTLSPVGAHAIDTVRLANGSEFVGLLGNASEATQQRFRYYEGFAGRRTIVEDRQFYQGFVVRCGLIPPGRPLAHNQRAYLLPESRHRGVGLRLARSAQPSDRRATPPPP